MSKFTDSVSGKGLDFDQCILDNRTPLEKQMVRDSRPTTTLHVEAEVYTERAQLITQVATKHTWSPNLHHMPEDKQVLYITASAGDPRTADFTFYRNF